MPTMHCGTEVNALNFEVKRSKIEVMMELLMPETALYGRRHTALDVLPSS